MKKKLSKKTLKIVAATAMCVFTLFSVFSASIAWFQTIMKVDSSNTEMGIKVNRGILDYVEFHRCTSLGRDNTTGKVTSMTFDKNAYTTLTYNWNSYTLTGDIADLSMETYTPLDQEHPLLILFAFDQDYSSPAQGHITIKAQSTANGFLGARNGNFPVNTLGDSNVYIKTGVIENKTVYYYALSSATKFYYQDFSNDEYSDFSGGNALTFTTSNLLTNETFVHVDNEAETSSFNSHPTLYASAANDTIKYVALIIDYYEDAIEFIYSTYLGNTTLEDTYGGFLRFICDWSLEVC